MTNDDHAMIDAEAALYRAARFAGVDPTQAARLALDTRAGFQLECSRTGEDAAQAPSGAVDDSQTAGA